LQPVDPRDRLQIGGGHIPMGLMLIVRAWTGLPAKADRIHAPKIIAIHEIHMQE